MRPATLSTGHQRLLQRFSAAGGVVEFVLLECDEPNEDVISETTHRQAVLAGMEVIQQRIDSYAEETAKKMNFKKSKISQVQFDEDLAKGISGKHIDNVEFLGPRYDFERRGLIVRGKGKILNEFFFYTDPAKPDNILPPDNIDHGVGVGFAYAFSSPPYPIQMKAEKVGKMLEKMMSFVLGGVTKNSVIFEWPTNWSNYFEAGDEWWGSFLWSLANPDSPQIAVIAASSSD